MSHAHEVFHRLIGPHLVVDGNGVHIQRRKVVINRDIGDIKTGKVCNILIQHFRCHD